MSKHRFEVVDRSSYYAVLDTRTGKESSMGDGADCVFDESGKAMDVGTEEFRLAWEKELNWNPQETAAAYFNIR